MLVLQPSISTPTEGPLGGLVCVSSGVLDGSKVGAGVAVIKGIGVNVGTCGVDVALAATTSGVAVKMDGVGVEGRNGVGGLKGPGWITQPLHDAKRSIIRIMRVVFFMSSPPYDCTPHASKNRREEPSRAVSRFVKVGKLPHLIQIIRVVHLASVLVEMIGSMMLKRQHFGIRSPVAIALRGTVARK